MRFASLQFARASRPCTRVHHCSESGDRHPPHRAQHGNSIVNTVPRDVVADLDAAAVLGDDAADDREAEPAAAPLGRIVRHEQLVAVGRPGCPGRCRRRRCAPRRSPRRAASRSRWWRLAVGRGRLRAAERLDGVVDEVDDDAADLLDVEPHRRQRRARSAARADRRGRARCRAPASRSSSAFRSAGTARGAGIRANCANSSTSALSDSTSPTIVDVHSSTSARVGSAAPCRSAAACARRRAGSASADS